MLGNQSIMKKIKDLSFFKASAAILAVEFGLFGFVSVMFDKSWILDNTYILITHAAYIYLISILTWLLLTRPDSDAIVAPKVRIVRNDLILVEPRSWISIGVLVSVHILEDHVERLACLGAVINIQINGLTQIKIQPEDDGDSERIMKKLLSARMENIIIKPGMHVGR